MKGRPVAFVPTSDPKRAARWYVAKLGMRHVAHEPYASVVRDASLTIRLALTQNDEPAPYAILGWEVASLSRALRELRAKRVKPLRDPTRAQDKAGVWTSPEGARVAWFRDPDGNVLSLTQPPRRR